MDNNYYILAIILTVSFVTLLLRLAPFLAISFFSKNSYLHFIGERMPVGIMLLLVFYTLKDIDITTYPYGLPHLIAISVSVILYFITRNSLICILSGLIIYLLAVNQFF